MKLRQSLLRGIYEDNLRIIRNTPRQRYRKRISPAFKFLVSLVFIFGVLVMWDYIESRSIDDQKLSASLRNADRIMPAGGQSAATVAADYGVLLDAPNIPLSQMFGLDIKTVMIDPGHGGADSGAIGKMGTMEKELVLDIAKRLKKRLELFGQFDVILTREDDVTVPLNMRVELARMSRADLFISIHLNYLPSRPINIIETYYFGPSSDEKTLRLAEEENRGSHYSLNDFRQIIEKIGDTIKLQESRDLAESIQKNLFVNSKRHDSEVYDFGVKRAPFVVLLGTDVPSVLAEVSCLSNRDEERSLNTGSHRENIARYLADGILDYIYKGEQMYGGEKFAEIR